MQRKSRKLSPKLNLPQINLGSPGRLTLFLFGHSRIVAGHGAERTGCAAAMPQDLLGRDSFLHVPGHAGRLSEKAKTPVEPFPAAAVVAAVEHGPPPDYLPCQIQPAYHRLVVSLSIFLSSMLHNLKDHVPHLVNL